MHIQVYECTGDETRKKPQSGLNLTGELNGYLDWIFLTFFFLNYRPFWQSGKAYGPSQNYAFKSLNIIYRNPKKSSYIEI